MSSFVNGRRVFAAFILAFAFLAVYQRSSEKSQVTRIKAQAPFLASKFAGEDPVTTAIRTDANVLTRIYVKSDADRKAAGQVGKIVQDYGSFVLVAKNKQIGAKGYGLEEQTVETTVNLPGAGFDPVKQPPQGSLRLGAAATANGDGYYVLQFGATATDEWLRSVADAGVEVLQYVPHQAYIVYGSSEAIARVANHSRVRWIGPYSADQKLTSEIRKQIETAANGKQLDGPSSKKQTALFDVGVFARANLDSVASELQRSFGKGSLRLTRLDHHYFDLVRLELSVDDLEKVAAIPDVTGISAVTPARNEDARSGHILTGGYSSPTSVSNLPYLPGQLFGADGTNVTVSVVDDGVGIPGDGEYYIRFLNAVNGPLRGAAPGAFGHGHLNATIIAGSTQPPAPANSSYGIGIAPGANIINIPRNRVGYTGSDAQVYDDSVNTVGNNSVPAMISNNSWGFSLEPGDNPLTYTQLKEGLFDGFVLDASLDGSSIDPITLIFSAGNAGTAGLTRPKVAKNVIAVGNVENFRPELDPTKANNIDDLAVDSSQGPAADGRIKPDLVAPGVAVTGGRSGMNSLNGNIDTFHRWSSGTSQAAANVTGAAALFASWYRQEYDVMPSPAMIKAALINSAVDLNGQGTLLPIPNRSEGWGRPNLSRIMSSGLSIKFDETWPQTYFTEMTHGYNINGSVADGSKPVRVTLVWSDPPGISDPALVNNLDLTVTVGGVTYKGNVFSNGVSVAGGAADTKNNVECVFLPANIPAGTTYSVSVTPTALNDDGILGNGDPTDQKFALVVNNFSNNPGTSFYRLEGKAVSATGRGIGSAKVRITNAQGFFGETQTSAFGHFAFPNIPGGPTYTVRILAKRFVFAQQDVTVTSNLSGLIFTANPGGP